jgi:uncharacterized protein (DUF1684 family)
MKPESQAADEPYLGEVESWRGELDERLRRPDGWLALAGLHWLNEGPNTIGSGPEAGIRLPSAVPPYLGVIELRQGKVLLSQAPGLPPVEGAPPLGESLRPDTTGDPHRLRWGAVTLVVIERGERIGLRVWDNARRERTDFPGRRWYPVDLTARVPARFEPADTRERIAVPNQLGAIEDEPLLGAAVFHWRGEEGRLLAVPTGDGGLWFLFADLTNGETTYPAGRFLVAETTQSGTIVLDFNRAYNPPCAFTAFATCPLPPEANHLSFKIEAGERYGPVPSKRDPLAE